MNHDLDFLTIENVAEILHISKQKVSALIRSGEIKVIHIGPRSRRIARSDLEEYIEKHK